MKELFPYPSPAPRIERVPSGSSDAYDDPRCSLDFIIYHPDQRWASDWIRVQSFNGQDAVSDFFHYEVELRANDQYVPARTTTPPAELRSLDFGTVLGNDAMIRIGLPVQSDTDGGATAPRQYTPFCGMVTDLVCSAPGVYRVTVKPRLFRLTLRNGYRIFRGLTVKGVVDTLLTEHGIKDYDLSALDGIADGRRQDWLQAGETDYELLHRLIARVGGYFYFEHVLPSALQSPGIHKVIFGREPAYKRLLDSEGETLTLYYTFSRESSGLDSEDLLTELSYQQSLMPSGVSTTVAEVGSSWLQEPLAQVTKSSKPTQAEPPTCVRYDVYEYGTCQAETDSLSSLREGARVGASFTLSASSTATPLKSGHWLTLGAKVPPQSGGDRPDISNYRPELDGKSFVLMSVKHQATVEGSYANSFTARDQAGSVLQFSIGATHQGNVLARVVAHGGQGDAPHPRHYLATGDFALGRKTFENTLEGASSAIRGGKLPCKGVYVQFVVGDQQPVFVKVGGSSPTIPEVGTWVVVGRSYNDSELPEVQQIVQSKGGQIIVPDEENPRCATEHTSVGNSYNTNYGDSHSIRYGRLSPVDLEAAAADLKNAYGTGEYKDVSYSVGGSYSVSKADAGAGGPLSHSIAIGSTYSNSDAATTESHAKIGEATSVSEIGESDSKTTVSGTSKSYSNINISDSTTIIGDSISDTHITRNTTNTSLIDGNSVGTSTINGNSTNTSTVNGNSTNTSTVNGNSTNTTTINGTSSSTTTIPAVSNSISTIGISNSVSTIGVSSGVSTVGSSNNVTTVGAATSLSTTGASVGVSLSGATASTSLSGLSASISVAGVSDSMSTVGSSTLVQIVGSQSRLEVVGPGAKVELKPGQLRSRILGTMMKLSNIDAKIVTLDTTV